MCFCLKFQRDLVMELVRLFATKQHLEPRNIFADGNPILPSQKFDVRYVTMCICTYPLYWPFSTLWGLTVITAT